MHVTTRFFVAGNDAFWRAYFAARRKALAIQHNISEVLQNDMSLLATCKQTLARAFSVMVPMDPDIEVPKQGLFAQCSFAIIGDKLDEKTAQKVSFRCLRDRYGFNICS